MNNPFFNKIAILGVGLLGASFALAAKKHGLCTEVSGFGRNETNLHKAKERGIIDIYSIDAAEACIDADFVLIATPVGILKTIANSIKENLKKGALVTDVGSVKGSIVAEIETVMPENVFYVGSHPIAGSEKSGIDDAKAELFNKALCILTPTDKSNSNAAASIKSTWERIGARVETMSPSLHDEIYAAVSHLPHIVSYALVNAINDINPNHIGYAGQGFKDTTRIAMSSSEMWRDIAIANKDNLIKFMDVFRKNLDGIEFLLKNKDTSGLEKEFLKAKHLREKLR
jgi:prephenate dehydrogenase